MMVSLIPIESVGLVWDKVQPVIDKAVETSHGRYTPVDVLNLCASGHQQLWVMFEGETVYAAATTSITQYPSARVLSGVFVGGTRMKDWADEFVGMLERFARDMGCTSVEMTGRKGWARYMQRFEWKQMAVVLEKDLSNE